MRCYTILFLCLPLSAQWMPLGPFGGSAAVVVADPHSSKTFLAGTRNALLFVTRDAGESWTRIPFPPEFQGTLNALAVDPETPGVYLAALSSDLPQYSGILRSTDAGATWRQLPDLRDEQVRAIAFKRADSRILAAGTDTGVFASQDGAKTWRRISELCKEKDQSQSYWAACQSLLDGVYRFDAETGREFVGLGSGFMRDNRPSA